VAAAVAIQQGIDRLNRSGKAPVPLEVRVGLSAGDVSFEDDDVHGTPVIEASRLCAVARGNEILMSEIVRLLAGMGDEDFVDRGRLELKGLQKPVSAWEARWEPARVSTVPMPALLADLGRIFVGRDADLERLLQLWKEAAAGEPRVALIAGEPGVGKTRLAAEVALRIHEEGGTVLAGRCDEDLGVPYQPFVEALRHFVDHVPPQRLREGLGRYGGELARLVPELADTVPGLPPPLGSDPETERYRLFDGVAAWLATASREGGPVLLVLDDLHWAAKPTLLLLRHLLRFSEPLRMLILGTYRDTELGRRHPLGELLADLRRQGGVERLSLSGLDGTAVANYVEEAAGHRLAAEDEALAQAIHAETAGNPFFVGEVLRHLAETGAVERREGRWVTTVAIEAVGIPEGIRDVVGRRLGRLSDDCNDVLAMAAVVGTEFELAVLRHAAQVPEEVFTAALDEAVTTRLVRDIPTSAASYRFAHALVRATLYEELSAARRVACHRKVAEAIEAAHPRLLDEHLPALAYHYAQAAVPAAGLSKAVEYCRRAGDAALAQLAHDDAARHYRQALDLLRLSEVAIDDPQGIGLLIALGEAQRRAGDPQYRDTLLEAARLAEARGDAKTLARAALANSRGAWGTTGGVDADRVVALRAALRLAPEGALAARAELLANLAAETAYAVGEDACNRLLDEALALARRAEDPRTLAKVLLARYRPLAGPQAIEQRAAESSELLTLSEDSGDPIAVGWALLLRGRSAMEMGDRDECDRCFARAALVVAEARQPFIRWFDALYRAGLATAAGQTDEAEHIRRVFLDLGTVTGMPETAAAYGGLLMMQRRLDGDPAEAESFLRQGLDDLPGLEFVPALLGWLAAETGRLDEAQLALEAARTHGFARPPRNQFYAGTLACWSAVAAHMGDRDCARVIADKLTPFAEHIVAPANIVLGSLTHTRGVLAAAIGEFDEAESQFASAEAQHERLRFPPWVACTRFEWALMLLTRRHAGDEERARRLLGRVLVTTRELGLATLERRAVALLGERP